MKNSLVFVLLIWALIDTWTCLGFPAQEASPSEIDEWCSALKHEIKIFQWKLDPCSVRPKLFAGRSVQKRPLFYFDFGDKSSSNVTLVFSMVHGDENSPLYVSLRLVEWLDKNIKKFPWTRIIVVPLVNPDGFFAKNKTRVNSNGVDLNRNFPTADWDSQAMAVWKKKLKSDPRRNPGKSPNSEPETQFQISLIEKFKPQKILSIHSPLNFMDYDGPQKLTLSKFPTDYVKSCLELRSRVKAVSGGYYVGSLGNYAGQERGIPTLTLELPSAIPWKAEYFWKRFQSGIDTVIQFKVPSTGT